MDINKNANLSMLCDYYELTMGNGYFVQGMQDRITYFDIFFRSVPDNGGFAIAAGLEQAIEYVQQLHFDEDDIAYLRSRNMFDEGFLQYLRGFRFTGDIWAVPEGTPIFPREPIMTVRAPAIQAQLVETFLLLTLNHQSLIATKANRVVRAAKGRTVLEFGSRRAQGVDAAVDGARAAYIGGCKGTACTLTDQLYGVPAGGTMAHSWVQMFPSEYEAFKAYCETYPDNPTLLVDTYNTLKSGIPNAIRVFNEVLKPRGLTKCGIRLDSGDMTYLTKKARKLLDEAGWQSCKISCSNSLDEYIIEDILNQGAQIDLFGVGERLITAKSEAVFGGEGAKRANVRTVERTRRAATRIAREELKHVRADRHGGLSHREVAAGTRKMTSNPEHQPTTNSSFGKRMRLGAVSRPPMRKTTASAPRRPQDMQTMITARPTGDNASVVVPQLSPAVDTAEIVSKSSASNGTGSPPPRFSLTSNTVMPRTTRSARTVTMTMASRATGSGTVRRKSVTASRPRQIARIESTKTAHVVTLMPPPAPPGAAPMNMSTAVMNRVTGLSSWMGMTVNPHVRGVTAWKMPTPSFSEREYGSSAPFHSAVKTQTSARTTRTSDPSSTTRAWNERRPRATRLRRQNWIVQRL